MKHICEAVGNQLLWPYFDGCQKTSDEPLKRQDLGFNNGFARLVLAGEEHMLARLGLKNNGKCCIRCCVPCKMQNDTSESTSRGIMLTFMHC